MTLPARSGRRGTQTVEVHRTRSLHPTDVTALRGIPITTVARTLVDLAEVLPAAGLARAVHEAEVLRLLDTAAIHAALARLPGRRHANTLLDALAEPAPAIRSALEERFLHLCKTHRIPLPEMNVCIPVADRLIEVDALWRDARLIVELDGAAAHHTSHAFHDDRRRDTALAAEGYLVVRLTWQRVTQEPATVADELRRILEQRAHLPQSPPSGRA